MMPSKNANFGSTEVQEFANPTSMSLGSAVARKLKESAILFVIYDPDVVGMSGSLRFSLNKLIPASRSILFGELWNL
jgi:hypothetical protein